MPAQGLQPRGVLEHLGRRRVTGVHLDRVRDPFAEDKVHSEQPAQLVQGDGVADPLNGAMRSLRKLEGTDVAAILKRGGVQPRLADQLTSDSQEA